MGRELRETGAVSQRARRLLDRLHEKSLNFDPDHLYVSGADAGWNVDDYCRSLPSEPPGPPVPEGPWEIARRLIRNYEFADPAMVRAVYYGDEPFENLNMVLEGRFYGLRFHFGVRIAGLTDDIVEVDGREVRMWGWIYRTLQGHLEMGEMEYQVWKWLDTGEVEFRIHVVSKPGVIPNPIIRLGFLVFGRWMQRRFARRALERLDRMVRTQLAEDEPPIPESDRATAQLEVEPSTDVPRSTSSPPDED